MNRLKRLADRDDSYYTMEAADERSRVMEKYLKDAGWKEAYIGLWQNPEYPRVECIDTNAGSATMITKGFTREYGKETNYSIADGIKIDTEALSPDVMVYDDNKFIISNTDGLKSILEKIK